MLVLGLLVFGGIGLKPLVAFESGYREAVRVWRIRSGSGPGLLSGSDGGLCDSSRAVDCTGPDQVIVTV